MNRICQLHLIGLACDEQQLGIHMIGKWTKSGKGLFATTATGYAGEVYHLLVERIPGQSRARAWDWTIWRTEGLDSITRHGYAPSARAGISAAERAAATELMGRALTMGSRSTVRDSSHDNEQRQRRA